MNEIDIAQLAMLIDTECNIYCKRNSCGWLEIRLQLGTGSEELARFFCDVINEILGKNLQPKYYDTAHFHAWHKQLTGHKQVKKVLEIVLPYLRAKKEQAKKILKLIDSRSKNKPREWQPHELALYREIRAMYGAKACRDSRA